MYRIVISQIENKLLVIFSILFFTFSIIIAKNVKVENLRKNFNNLSDSLQVTTILLQSREYRFSDNRKALKLANQALEISKSLHYQGGEIRSNYEIGSIFILQSQHNSANTYFYNGLKLSKKIDNELLIALGYFNLGQYNFVIKNYSKSIDFINKASLIFSELKNEIEISRCYSLLGNIYNDLSNYEKSLNYFFKALKI